MERKQYLELCQKYAVGQDVMVECGDIVYRPISYELSFDKSGKSMHTAITKDRKANCYVRCKMEDLKEHESKESN